MSLFRRKSESNENLKAVETAWQPAPEDTSLVARFRERRRASIRTANNHGDKLIELKKELHFIEQHPGSDFVIQRFASHNGAKYVVELRTKIRDSELQIAQMDKEIEALDAEIRYIERHPQEERFLRQFVDKHTDKA